MQKEILKSLKVSGEELVQPVTIDELSDHCEKAFNSCLGPATKMYLGELQKKGS